MLLLAVVGVDEDLLAINATTSLEVYEVPSLEFIEEVASNREIISTSGKILSQKRMLTRQSNCRREQPMRGEQQ